VKELREIGKEGRGGRSCAIIDTKHAVLVDSSKLEDRQATTSLLHTTETVRLNASQSQYERGHGAVLNNSKESIVAPVPSYNDYLDRHSQNNSR
jgi:hypothetical protein